MNTTESTKTKIFLLTSSYDNFCGNDVFDSPFAISDNERNNQCYDFIKGFLLLPLIPVMIMCDIVSYPVRKLLSYFL